MLLSRALIPTVDCNHSNLGDEEKKKRDWDEYKSIKRHMTVNSINWALLMPRLQVYQVDYDA